ncbi:hypothetical protein [Paenibacillus solanacearum]|nr:hypothetical protein [Paenibacillus solanacearum]
MARPISKLCAFFLLFGSAALMSSCSTAPPQDESKPAAAEPVHLTFYARQTISDDDFKLLFTEPLRKRYPHVTL